MLIIVPPVIAKQQASYLIRGPRDKPSASAAPAEKSRRALRARFFLLFRFAWKYTLRHESSKNAEFSHCAASSARQMLSRVMNLRELVRRYVELAGKFGVPIALSSFSLSAAETER